MPRGIRIHVSDSDLRRAIRRTDSWRGVLRQLGYATTNGHTAAEFRERALRLGCDTSHFRRPTKWTDAQLRRAVARGKSWADVLRELGLTTSGNAAVAVKARAIKLGLDYSQLQDRRRAPRGEVPSIGAPRTELLRSAAPSVAASWFIARGCHVSWPLEPCPYDLVVDISRTLYRVQVKTATGRDTKTREWTCGVAQNGNGKGTPYDPDDIDFFFIIDASGGMYLVPIEDVAGQSEVSLGTLEYRKLDNGS